MQWPGPYLLLQGQSLGIQATRSSVHPGAVKRSPEPSDESIQEFWEAVSP